MTASSSNPMFFRGGAPRCASSKAQNAEALQPYIIHSDVSMSQDVSVVDSLEIIEASNVSSILEASRNACKVMKSQIWRGFLIPSRILSARVDLKSCPCSIEQL